MLFELQKAFDITIFFTIEAFIEGPQNSFFSSKHLRVSYVYIKESFDAIFITWVMGGGGVQRPSRWVVGRENHPWDRGLFYVDP